MKKLIYTIIAIVAAAVTFSCTDGSSIGGSLGEETIVIVVDSNFTVTGASKPIDSVQSRTLSQLVGNIEARGFGNIYSDFVGQFMPSLQLDTANVHNQEIDSVKLFMAMTRGSFVGDSLAPMGLTVYRLNKDLPYPIYSNFSPEGYYNPSDVLCDGVYTASTMNEPDSIQELSAVFAAMKLPREFGQEILDAYIADKAAFSDPETFARDVFKGVYIKSSYGSGRITDFTTTSIRFYFHKEVWNEDSARYDTTVYVGDYLAVTPEVVVNNNIRYEIADELKSLAAAEPVVAAPVGYEVEMRFPGPELVASFRGAPGSEKVLNTLSFSVPVEKIDNDYDIAPPPYVLMVLKTEKEKFFASNSLADNATSFYASYDEAKRCYTFGAMRDYMVSLLAKDSITEDDYTFVLTPVQVNMEAAAGSTGYYGSATSYVVSSIVPYVSTPSMAKILLDKAKIKLTFSANNGK